MSDSTIQRTAALPTEVAWRLGWHVDHLIRVDYTARGAIDVLYPAAVAAQGGKPLAMAAARALYERVQPGDPVLLVTGFPARTWLVQDLTETDGPVGAAVLARILEETLDAVPVMVTGERLVRFAEAPLRAAGLIVTDLQTARRSKPGPPKAAAASVIPFTADRAPAEQAAQALLSDLRPAAVVSVEMPGPNRQGAYGNVSGRALPDHLVPKADVLVETARQRGVLTVGIGDGGNEIGMGSIENVVRARIPHGERIAARTVTDRLVAACISNWGAYGVGACLLALAGRPDILGRIDVPRVVAACAGQGAIDGLSARPAVLEDGATPAQTEALLTLLGAVARSALEGWVKG